MLGFVRSIVNAFVILLSKDSFKVVLELFVRDAEWAWSAALAAVVHTKFHPNERAFQQTRANSPIATIPISAKKILLISSNK